MNNSETMVNVFDFGDYRVYMRAWFDAGKKADPAFSHRYLAAKLGLSTPNHLLVVMQGKRSLSPSLRFNLSMLMKHTRKEASYFEHMVSFAQAKSHDERDAHCSAMLGLRSNLASARLEKKQYDYYTYWYNMAIRELVTAPGFAGDYRTLAKSLTPAITADQAQSSVKLLLDLGLIRSEEGRYVQSDAILSTGPELVSTAAANFHRKAAHLAAESFDRHSHNERTITSCTVTLSENHFQMLKREMADLRRRALELAEDPVPGNRVYQMNLHLFPMTRPIADAGGK